MDRFLPEGADPNLKSMVERLFVTTFNGRGNDRAHAIEVFEKHNEDVIRSLPRYRLLCFNVKDGWEPLCRFLSLPAPDEPFPRLNSSDDWLSDMPKDGAASQSVIDAVRK
jgi:hypothetical protein